MEFEKTKNNNIEKILSEATDMYKTLFESANDAIFIMQEDRFIECNTKTLEIFGCTKDQILNQTPSFFSPQFQPDGIKSEEKARKYILEALNGVAQRFEWKHIKYDNTLFDSEVSLNKLDINGNIFLQAIVRDISERKIFENLLKVKEQRIRAIFDNAFDFIGLLSIDGILIEANRSSLENSGIAIDEVIGKPFWDTPWWSHSEQLQIQLKDSIIRASLGESISFEATHPASDGSMIVVDFSIKPVKDNNGNIIQLIPFGRDITSKKNSDEKLKVSEERFKLLSSMASEGIMIHENGIILDANQAFLDIIGFSSLEEIVGKNGVEIMPFTPESRKLIIESMKSNSNLAFDVILVRPDGSTVYAETQGKEFIYLGVKLRLVYMRDITDRKKAEEKLIEAEEKYKILINAFPDDILVTDYNYKILYANPALERHQGRSLTDLKSLGGTTIIHPDDRNYVLSSINNLINSDLLFTDIIENRIIQGDKVFWRSGIVCKLTFDDTPAIMIISRDFSNQKYAEEELKKSEERFRLILENMPILLNAFDDSGKIIVWNKACEKVTGYSAEEIIGNPNSMELLYPDPNYLKLVIESSNNPNNQSNVFDLVAKNGEKRTIEWFDIYHFLKIPGWSSWGMGQDITVRKRNEESIRSSENRLQLATRAGNIGIWDWDIENNILIWDESMYFLYGIRKEDFNGAYDAWLKTIHPEDADLTDNEIQAAIRGEKEYAPEFRIILPNGNIRIIQANSQTFRDNNGKAIRMIGTNIDITERKKAEQELLELNNELENRVEERTIELKNTLDRLEESYYELNLLNEQETRDSQRIIKLNDELMNSQEQLKEVLATKDKFFSIIAHDLKNPFVALLNNSELLENYFEKMDDSQKLSLIHQIKNASKSTYSLLDNLLQWASSQRGTIPFNQVETELYDLVLKIVLSIKSQADHKNILLSINIPLYTKVFCDIDMISTIFRNLISNAIKFTHKGGIIEIGIVQSENHQNLSFVQIFVKDFGIGIPNEILLDLFRIDKKVSRPGTEKESSSGIGLILCKEFVEKHGGKIWVESEEGKGSTFYFTLKVNN
jgi:PAS domain S-box-containing protein